MTTNDQLRKLMSDRDLSRREVAAFLGIRESRSYTFPALDAWLIDRRNMPAAKLELLRMKLPERSHAGN